MTNPVKQATRRKPLQPDPEDLNDQRAQTPTSHINIDTTPGESRPAPFLRSPNTRQRLGRLAGPATWIFEAVLWAMQDSEECGGPEEEEYYALMQAIIDEATDRVAQAREGFAIRRRRLQSR